MSDFNAVFLYQKYNVYINVGI